MPNLCKKMKMNNEEWYAVAHTHYLRIIWKPGLIVFHIVCVFPTWSKQQSA